MDMQALIADVTQLVDDRDAEGVGCDTGVDGLFAFASSGTTVCTSTLYEPLMCLVLQGRKEAQLGDRRLSYGAGDTLIVSHAVPAVAGIVEASRTVPYVALALRLDMALLRSLYDEIGPATANQAPLQSMDVSQADADLLDAVARLFRLSRNPVECKTLAPLVLKEIHFRLLMAHHGGMLRQLLLLDSPASRISKAIALLRDGYRDQIPVANLAAVAGMSASAFHEHFKSVTSTTPLQYQKDLRLLEARRLLTGGETSVAAAAFDVGYESPTQFSREYTRKFGVSPRQDKMVSVA